MDGRARRPARRRAAPLRAALLVAAAAALASPLPAAAQTIGDFALMWTHGDFRSPLVCEVEGAPRRVLRRVRIAPVTHRTHRRMNRMVFYDLEAPHETRCHDDRGADEPNVIGAVTFFHEGRRDRPDIGQHEFAEQLRREGAFSFEIASGRLRIGAPGAPPAGLPVVDFAEGTARFRAVERGSDAWRLLSEFGPVEKRVLELEAPDGTTLAIHLVGLGPGALR